jgi:DNA-binding NarL/FixJ family response regulator
VARGGKYISDTLAEKLAGLVDLGTLHAPHEQLSDREFAVLCSLGRGLTVKEVAGEMQLSAKTISTYRSRLMEKMGLSTNADLVRYVVEHDLMK